jgi:hypothetical protein
MRANETPLFLTMMRSPAKNRPAGHPAKAGHDATAASHGAFVPCAEQSAKRQEPPSKKRGGHRLNAGNSENGGAGNLDNNHRSNSNDNLGARLAVVFLARKRFTPPIRHFGDLPKRLG